MQPAKSDAVTKVSSPCTLHSYMLRLRLHNPCGQRVHVLQPLPHFLKLLISYMMAGMLTASRASALPSGPCRLSSSSMRV